MNLFISMLHFLGLVAALAEGTVSSTKFVSCTTSAVCVLIDDEEGAVVTRKDCDDEGINGKRDEGDGEDGCEVSSSI